MKTFLILVIAGLFASSAHGTVIGFDDASGSMAVYNESGFTFSLLNGNSTWYGRTRIDSFPAPSISGPDLFDETLVMTTISGDPFSLSQLDLQSFQNQAGSSLRITGTLFGGGSSINQTFALPASSATGSDVTINPVGFSNLQSVNFIITGDAEAQIDNINALVPEPSTAVLLGLGLTSLAVRRRVFES